MKSLKNFLKPHQEGRQTLPFETLISVLSSGATRLPTLFSEPARVHQALNELIRDASNILQYHPASASDTVFVLEGKEAFLQALAAVAFAVDASFDKLGHATVPSHAGEVPDLAAQLCACAAELKWKPTRMTVSRTGAQTLSHTHSLSTPRAHLAQPIPASDNIVFLQAAGYSRDDCERALRECGDSFAASLAFLLRNCSKISDGRARVGSSPPPPRRASASSRAAAPVFARAASGRSIVSEASSALSASLAPAASVPAPGRPAPRSVSQTSIHYRASTTSLASDTSGMSFTDEVLLSLEERQGFVFVDRVITEEYDDQESSADGTPVRRSPVDAAHSDAATPHRAPSPALVNSASAPALARHSPLPPAPPAPADSEASACMSPDEPVRRGRAENVMSGRKESISQLIARGYKRVEVLSAVASSAGVDQALEILQQRHSRDSVLDGAAATPPSAHAVPSAPSTPAAPSAPSTPAAPIGTAPFKVPSPQASVAAASVDSDDVSVPRVRSKSLPCDLSLPDVGVGLVVGTSATAAAGGAGFTPFQHVTLDWRRELVGGKEVSRLRAGSLEDLLAHLVSDRSDDSEVVNTFAVCGHLFSSVDEILAFVLSAHHAITERHDAARGPRQVRRLVKIISVCLPHYFDGMSAASFEGVCAVLADGLRMGLLPAVLEARLQLLACRTNALATPQRTTMMFQTTTRKLLDVSAMDLAQQLSLVQWQHLRALRIKEVLQWRCKQDKIACASVVACTDLFNNMSQWCSTQIISPETAAERGRVYTRMVEVIACLFKLNDFATMFALISGVQVSSVSRLSQTLETVRGSTVEQLRRCAAVMDPVKSNKAYRDALSACRPPMVPYLGVHLTDLTFAEQASKKTVPCADGCGADLIFFRKYALLYNTCAPLLRAQEEPYGFPIDDDIVLLFNNFSHESTDNIHGLSLYREPRDASTSVA